ncbi:hypothetical protein SEMRO_2720_G335460.1 [Seminavis robusta]|uniref:Uncharacterized protein n=1 Tax=Seminavis robusta TaxID=568900 RepID=A0A9N8I0I8_9STRA|nr:hypothetical protein SEMRO_2720_G335460.1 [Seminavis robusta]|eukprot:Sro2720_g335460.1 n/a (288) ;mRNA; r:2179-3042
MPWIRKLVLYVHFIPQVTKSSSLRPEIEVEHDQDHYLFTNPYTGKSYIKKKQQPMQNSATMPHQQVVQDGTEEFDFDGLFNTSASKNRCAVKRRLTIVAGTASVFGRASKAAKTGSGSVMASVLESIHLGKNNSDVTDKPDDDDDSLGSEEDFNQRVKSIVDDHIGNNLDEYARKKFVKSIRDPITKAQKEALERLRSDVVPQLNVINENAKNAVAKTVQFRLEYDQQKARDRRFEEFVVEKLGQMNGTIEALGRYMLRRLGSADGLDDSSLANMVALEHFDGVRDV